MASETITAMKCQDCKKFNSHLAKKCQACGSEKLKLGKYPRSDVEANRAPSKAGGAAPGGGRRKRKAGKEGLDLTAVEMFVSEFGGGKVETAAKILEALGKHDPAEMLEQLTKYQTALNIQNDKSKTTAEKLKELAAILS